MSDKNFVIRGKKPLFWQKKPGYLNTSKAPLTPHNSAENQLNFLDSSEDFSDLRVRSASVKRPNSQAASSQPHNSVSTCDDIDSGQISSEITTSQRLCDVCFSTATPLTRSFPSTFSKSADSDSRTVYSGIVPGSTRSGMTSSRPISIPSSDLQNKDNISFTKSMNTNGLAATTDHVSSSVEQSGSNFTMLNGKPSTAVRYSSDSEQPMQNSVILTPPDTSDTPWFTRSTRHNSKHPLGNHTAPPLLDTKMANTNGSIPRENNPQSPLSPPDTPDEHSMTSGSEVMGSCSAPPPQILTSDLRRDTVAMRTGSPHEELAARYFPVTLGAAYLLQSVDPTLAAKYVMETSVPNQQRGLPGPNSSPWKLPLRSVSPTIRNGVVNRAGSRRTRPGSAHSSSSSASKSSSIDRMHMLTTDAPATASASPVHLMSSPYQHELASLRMERLRIEEEQLLEVKRQDELERIRGPKPRWYEMKTPRFHYEAKKNNELLKTKKTYQELLDYREQLTQASRDYAMHTAAAASNH